MQLYTKEQAIRQMNYLGQSCRPFIFIINYQQDASYIEAVSSVDPAAILYNLNGFTNQPMFAENNIDFCQESDFVGNLSRNLWLHINIRLILSNETSLPEIVFSLT